MGLFIDACLRAATARLFLSWCVLAFLCQTGFGEDQYIQWEVHYMHWSPDCKESIVMGINGTFPGPTIRAREGDTIHVELTNKLYTEGVVIHWHGIQQRETPWQDGAAYISQCPINPGEKYNYTFKVDKAGTYFYHGHFGMQRSAGLYGSLIVEAKGKEPFHYDGEFNLLLSDWWHRSSHEQEVDLSAEPMRWIGEPQTLLINGRGQYNCSLTAPPDSENRCKFTGTEQCSPEVLHVQPNKKYRLRIASTTALASLNLAIGNHKMEVIEADGNYVKPFTVDNLDIYSGETYSILFTTDQDPSKNYWISVNVVGRKPVEGSPPPGLAILNYQENPASAPSPSPSTVESVPILNYMENSISEPPLAFSEPPLLSPPVSIPPLHRPVVLPPMDPPAAHDWNDYKTMKEFSEKVRAREGSPKQEHGKRIILLNTQNYIDGYTKWAINHVSLVLPPTPLLGSLKYNLTEVLGSKDPPENFSEDYDVRKPAPNGTATYGSGVYKLEFNSTVDVILQNANMIKNDSEIHPWHLHGHDFWVLGYGDGRFKEGDEKNFNLDDPPLRNTVVIFPYGWTALRFVADNPGVWAFHCHIEPHLHMGMGVVFTEGVDRIDKIPKEALACGMTAKHLMNASLRQRGGGLVVETVVAFWLIYFLMKFYSFA